MRSRFLAAAVAGAALLSSCSSETPASPTQTSPSPSTGHGTYASCLAENGVSTPPAGPGAPAGVDAQTWANAREACADEAPGPAS
nr:MULTISPECIES: hypothetical protein [unclassified Mycolicibacterium]